MCGFVGMHRYYTKRCRDESYLMAGRADKKMSIRTASGEENARRSVTSISDSKMAGTQQKKEDIASTHHHHLLRSYLLSASPDKER
jgi:hypothetical protein